MSETHQPRLVVALVAVLTRKAKGSGSASRSSNRHPERIGRQAVRRCAGSIRNRPRRAEAIRVIELAVAAPNLRNQTAATAIDI